MIYYCLLLYHCILAIKCYLLFYDEILSIFSISISQLGPVSPTIKDMQHRYIDTKLSIGVCEFVCDWTSFHGVLSKTMG